MTNNPVLQALSQRILILDGAMGTQLQARNLTAADFGGEAYEGCNEMLVLTRPDVIEDVHKAYLEAGADIVETCSFGSTDIVLAEYGLADKVFELNKAAAQNDLDLGSLAIYPTFAVMHNDPRWLPLLRSLGMAPEQLAAVKFDVHVPKQ